MKVETSIPAIDFAFSHAKESFQIQAENREIIRAVRAVNLSGSLGDSNELSFSLDQQTRRPIIRIVNRNTREVIEQIPNEHVLHLADDLKLLG